MCAVCLRLFFRKSQPTISFFSSSASSGLFVFGRTRTFEQASSFRHCQASSCHHCKASSFPLSVFHLLQRFVIVLRPILRNSLLVNEKPPTPLFLQASRCRWPFFFARTHVKKRYIIGSLRSCALGTASIYICMNHATILTTENKVNHLNFHWIIMLLNRKAKYSSQR